MIKRVVWQKWIDPFLTNTDDVESKEPEEPETYKDSYQKFEDKILSNQQSQLPKFNMPMMVSPMGIIPITEHNTPSKIFCFWMGHTNFDITAKIKELIEKTPGVETLDIFTRYRFRVAIGKAFIDENTDPFGKSVLLDIEKAICPKQEKKVELKAANIKKTTVNMLKKNLSAKNKFWAILEAEDGTLDPRKGNTKEEVVRLIEESHRNVLAKSWE